MPAGLLLSVLWVLGLCTFDDVPNLVQISKTFHPIPENRGLYDELYKEFLNIYKNNEKMYARLNR